MYTVKNYIHTEYIFILTQEFPLFVRDGHCNNATLQNEIQTFEFIDGVRKKHCLLTVHSNLEISNKFRKNKRGGEYSTSYKYFTLRKSFL